MPNYFNEAIGALETAQTTLKKKSLSKEDISNLKEGIEEALGCLDEVASVYGISTDDDEV